MATKKKSTPVKATDPGALNTLHVRQVDGKSDALVLAEAALCGITWNALTARIYTRGVFDDGAGIGIDQSVHVVRGKAARVHAGDLSELEALLTAQTTTLNAIFNEMARRAALNMGEHMPAMETYMRLALKAQSQCRTTVEALAEIKNPRAVAFVKQANIAHGHQQVNNGVPPAHGNNSIQSNELLEAQHGDYLDTGAAGATIPADSELATVGEINRAAN